VKSLKDIARRGALLAAGAGALLAPGTARALSCGINWVQYPSDGTAAVPTDTLLWGYIQSSEFVVSRLIGPAGEVAVEERFMIVESLGGQRLGIPLLVPQAELEGDTRYTIETWYDGGLTGPDTTEQLTFTTKTGPIGDAAPAPPAFIASEPSMGAGYYGSPNRWASFEFAPHSGILIGVDRPLAGDGATNSVTSSAGWLIDGSQLDAALDSSAPAIWWLTGGNVLSMGVGDCLIWPEFASDRIEAQFGVLDVAGNFSGWVDMPVEIPSYTEAVAALEAQAAQAATLRATPTSQASRSGCSLARSGAPGAALTSLGLGLFAAAALRARAKRRHGPRVRLCAFLSPE